MINFWDMVERSETGEILEETKFDRMLAAKVKELVKKYEIKFYPEEVIPSDDSLADRVFQAGLELFLDLGIFCIDTRRLIKFDKEEVMEALRRAPSRLQFGQGRDEAVMVYRHIEDKKEPFCGLTPVGNPVPEELFEKVVMSYAQEPMADSFSGPLITSLHGLSIKSGTPIEVEAAIWNAMKLRESARIAGRPGLGCHNFVSNAEKTDAIIAAARKDFGLLEGDGLLVAAIGELKVDYERLKKVAFLRHTEFSIGGLYGPLMGGYAGGPEGTAIVLLAHHFLGVLVFQAHWHVSFPLHIHHVCNTTREMIWLLSIVGQALSRNTHLLKMANGFTAAGPCTEMVIYELVAYAIASTISGSDMDPAAVARNRHLEHCSGMEARIAAEAGHLVARMGLKRDKANTIVKKIISKYESQMEAAPVGKKFSECYQLEKLKPTEEYSKLYDRAKDELTRMGLDYSYL
jgi:methylamine--corrinoid protein Co-methyltransferase